MASIQMRETYLNTLHNDKSKVMYHPLLELMMEIPLKDEEIKQSLFSPLDVGVNLFCEYQQVFSTTDTNCKDFDSITYSLVDRFDWIEKFLALFPRVLFEKVYLKERINCFCTGMKIFLNQPKNHVQEIKEKLIPRLNSINKSLSYWWPDVKILEELQVEKLHDTPSKRKAKGKEITKRKIKEMMKREDVAIDKYRNTDAAVVKVLRVGT